MGLNAERTVTKDRVIEEVGLPSRARYNWFVAEAVDQSKRGGDHERAMVMATLAHAEAVLLGVE